MAKYVVQLERLVEEVSHVVVEVPLPGVVLDTEELSALYELALEGDLVWHQLNDGDGRAGEHEVLHGARADVLPDFVLSADGVWAAREVTG